jgi:hypothetical protein
MQPKCVSAAIAACLLSYLLSPVPVCRAQQQTALDNYQMDQVSTMLSTAYSEVKKYYYDHRKSWYCPPGPNLPQASIRYWRAPPNWPA